MRLVLINSIIWAFFHFAISTALLKLPDSIFSPLHPSAAFFKEWFFEEKGKFWRVQFYVHRWKEWLPGDIGFFGSSSTNYSLRSKRLDTIRKMIIESKRRELLHWLLFIPAPYFFLWNPTWFGWAMILYSLFANVPFIIVQRYNRSRLTSLQTKMEKMIKRGAVYR